mgnify:CR=1 FL=1
MSIGLACDGEIEVALECAKHEKALDGSEERRRGMWKISVETCPDCLQEAREEQPKRATTH